MLLLSFYEWRCIYPGEQMVLAPFLEKTSLDRAPGRFADNLFVRKHAKADVLLTSVMGMLRRWFPAHERSSEHLHQWLQPSKQSNVAPFGQRGYGWRKRGPKLVCDGGVTARK